MDAGERGWRQAVVHLLSKNKARPASNGPPPF
jgi:hypothetical protein